MKRTDAHSPSNFVSGDYEFHECMYQGPVTDAFMDFESLREDRKRLRATVEAQGFKGNWASKGTCDHCGTWFHYGAVYIHLTTGDLVVVGHDCADHVFSPNTKRSSQLAAIKDMIATGKACNRRQAAVKVFLDATPGLAEALALAEQHYILAALAFNLNRYGNLSEKQVELAFKIVAQIKETEARKATQALEPKVPVVAGKRTVAGTVLATKVQDGAYGITYKMLVRLDSGEKVWGSIPGDLVTNDGIQVLRGQTVGFTATFEVSDKDPCFGFFKRPRQASVIAAA